MAQSTLHFGLGMLCATAFHIKPLLRAWLARQPMAPCIAKWCVQAYALGLLAIIPAIFRRMTGTEPEQIWWNIFLFYPLIDRLPLPSILLGELLMGTILSAQYGLIILAMYRQNKSQRSIESITFNQKDHE